jgi:hypothetical protein
MSDERGAAASAAPSPPAEFTAVVYFHGIGQQRHYEQVCRLVQRLDEYCYARYASGDPQFRDRRLVEIVGRPDPVEADGEEADDIVYVRAKLSQPDGAAPVQVRFFEAYWAPEAADAPGALAVVHWIARQFRTPLKTFFAPWRSYERLRRADLIALARARRDANPDDAEELIKRVTALVRRYGDFQDQSARRKYPSGSFADFRTFVSDGTPADQRLLELLEQWRTFHRRRQVLLMLSIASVLVGVVSAAGLLLLAVYWVLTWFSPFTAIAGTPVIEASPSMVSSAVAGLLAAFGVTRFLREYVGDVQQFVTYEEAEPLYRRRKAIIVSAVKHLRHVLADPGCSRVVLVCHSLGTAIAVDTLLELRRFNMARTPANPMSGPVALQKITHLVTMGSPVDKINYFFGALNSQYRVYECLVDSLRGDIGTPPFSLIGRQPWIHWINYWDRADVISGPIETVAPGILRTQEVDNVRVASYPLPAVLAAHEGYFRHSRVVGELFSIIFDNEYSYVRARAVAADRRRAGDLTARPDFEGQRRGPGEVSGLQRALFWLLPAMPWLMALTLLETLFARPAIAQWVLTAVVGVFVLAEWLHGRGYAHLRPLDGPADAGTSSCPAVELP